LFYESGVCVKNPALFWCSILLLMLSLFLVVTGASVTQQRAVGQDEGGVLSPANHKLTAEAVGTFSIVVALWLTFSKSERPNWLRGAAWGTVVIVIADAILGSVAQAASPISGFAHSLLAHLFVSATAVLVLGSVWAPVTHPIPDKGWPSLRGYAALTCALVVLQVIMGAGFRHELMGVMPHIIGALILALFILGLAMLVLNLPKESLPPSNPLKAPAIVLIILAGLQVSLGLTVASMGGRSRALTVMTISHAATGALTLAATVVLTVLIRQHRQREASQQ
jgi:heme A synthase